MGLSEVGPGYTESVHSRLELGESHDVGRETMADLSARILRMAGLE